MAELLYFTVLTLVFSSPLVAQDAGSQQIGFLLGSCGVTLALTTDACQKGLPKAQTGEVATFKGTACAFIFQITLKYSSASQRLCSLT